MTEEFAWEQADRLADIPLQITFGGRLARHFGLTFSFRPHHPDVWLVCPPAHIAMVTVNLSRFLARWDPSTDCLEGDVNWFLDRFSDKFLLLLWRYHRDHEGDYNASNRSLHLHPQILRLATEASQRGRVLVRSPLFISQYQGLKSHAP